MFWNFCRLAPKTPTLLRPTDRKNYPLPPHTHITADHAKMHKKHDLQLGDFTQDFEDDALTQGTMGTAASRMTLGTILTSATSATDAITPEDMDAFRRAVEAKSREMKDGLSAAKARHRAGEDGMQREILELQARKAAIDSDRERNRKAKDEAVRELNQIGSQMSSSLHRVRREDVDEAKRDAVKLAKDRDERNHDPRREEIVSASTCVCEFARTGFACRRLLTICRR